MNRCSYLGLEDDKHTCMTFASENHLCYKVSKQKKVPLNHQTAYCLNDNHLRCPVLLNGESRFPQAVKNQSIQIPQLKIILRWVAITGAVLLIFFSGLWLVNNPEIFTQPDPPVQASGDLPPGITPTATRQSRDYEPKLTLIYDLVVKTPQATTTLTPDIIPTESSATSTPTAESQD